MPWDLIPLNDGVCRHVHLLGHSLTLRIRLGNAIPSIAFGTWTLGNGQSSVDQVDQALSVGFSHIGTFITYGFSEPRDCLTDGLTDGYNATLTDTAQVYRNEEEVGKALRESGLARKDVYITTKYWGLNGLDIQTSIHNSLKMVGCAQTPHLHLQLLMIENWDCLTTVITHDAHNADVLYSWASNTWICTSSTLRVLRSPIFRLLGQRWKL